MNSCEGTSIAERKFRKELNAGTVSLVLLALLAREQRPLYGYEIARLLAWISDDEPLVKQGALYPVLRGLSAAGLLRSFVEPSVAGPPRRYYEITDSGRRELKNWSHIWRKVTRLVDTVLVHIPVPSEEENIP